MTERRAWRFSDGILVAGLVGLAAFATRTAWTDMFERGFRDEEQSHVLLAPFVALWLAWVRRERFRYTRPNWTLLGPAVIAAGYALSHDGFFHGRDAFFHLGAVMIVFGAALTVVGVDFVRKFGPAFFALLFAIPVPQMIRLKIATPLQNYSAQITQAVLEIFGVPVSLTGNLLTINGAEVAVAEACNGMRMVAALFLVSFAFVFSVPMRMGVRLLILALSPAVALLCNVIRLVPTALLYGYAKPDTATTFHDISGWVMLLVALGILWGVLGLLRWLEAPIAPYQVAEDEP